MSSALQHFRKLIKYPLKTEDARVSKQNYLTGGSNSHHFFSSPSQQAQATFENIISGLCLKSKLQPENKEPLWAQTRIKRKNHGTQQ